MVLFFIKKLINNKKYIIIDQVQQVQLIPKKDAIAFLPTLWHFKFMVSQQYFEKNQQSSFYGKEFSYYCVNWGKNIAQPH